MTKLSPALKKAHEAKLQLADATRQNMYTALKASGQPLTAQEIGSLAAQKTGRAFDIAYVRNILKYLVDTGKVASREETAAERKIRLGGRSNFNTGAHFTATYFWVINSKTGKTGPKRTKHTDEVAPVLVPHRSGSKKIRPAKAAKKQTGKSLMARIAELEARVAQLEKILG